MEMDTEKYYPWGGEFTVCTLQGCIAVVLLNIDYTPPPSVAIYGHLKTENIGIEKIIANVISNPHIRFLLICGEDIRGHQSGSSLVALHTYGIDENHRIKQARGAIPYIENLTKDAIERFQKQITLINLIGETDPNIINHEIEKCIKQAPAPFGKPYIALQMKPQVTNNLTDKRALHAKITLNYLGRIKKRGES
ncbi:MAG: hypothetical protein QXX20_08080 [Candidatus Thermoplasmatota archaeon]